MKGNCMVRIRLSIQLLPKRKETRKNIFRMIHIHAFSQGGRHLWPHFSQSFSDKNEEFLCSSERKFPEFCKTHPTFVSRPLLVPSMAHQTLSSVFFGTPCTYFNPLIKKFLTKQNMFITLENEIEMVRRKYCPCVNFTVYFAIGEFSNKYMYQ